MSSSHQQGGSGPSADEVRRRFLDFFGARGHTVVPSSSLIPRDDPTLLFTNAGMNQFKEVFLGHETRGYQRAASSQKCMRVSGKHNDLENVGPSTYHHTFFEMLGNFSFGDYFKPEAIEMAWELLTEGYGLPGERLWASVFEEDDEAWDLWKEIVGLPDDRLVRLGADENFWAMGETGPCGPCSEVHYDYGEQRGCGELDCGPACDCGRFVELWNLVFMQYVRNEPGGGLEPLPSPNIDTGAGLERLTAVLQGQRSNYDTDLFRPLIDAVAGERDTTYGEDEDADVALRVIADHSRAVAFLLADGVGPANEGRGYVLRRLIRRAVRFGMKLGSEGPFLHQSARRVVGRMGEVYPELEQAEDLIVRVTRSEEERFFQTLEAGTEVFQKVASELEESGDTTVAGEDAFLLYDTYGLPLDLTRELAADQGLQVDEEGFREAMERQRRRARAAWIGGEERIDPETLRRIDADGGSRFLGYRHLELAGAEVVGLLREGEITDSLEEGDEGDVILDRTPFYAEAGGQVGDRGTLESPAGLLAVTDTQRLPGGLIVHRVEVREGRLGKGDTVDARVDPVRRGRTVRNHTATHLLHAALREQLGEHVRQAGSLVAPDRLRFDFTHFAPVEPGRVEELEDRVNEVIRQDLDTEIGEMAYGEAIERGALAFFGEKYGDRVRVVTVPGVSMELCGGTHVEHTGEVGAFVIIHEESVAAGTRRIEAVTGDAAIAFSQRQRELLRRVTAELHGTDEEAPEQIARLQERLRAAEKEAEELRVKLASREASADLEAEGEEVDGVRIVAREVRQLDAGGLRNLADVLKAKLGSGIVVLGVRHDGKAQLIVGVTDDLTGRVGADRIVQRLAEVVGGGGGGHPGMAQAGGPQGDRLDEALERAPKIVRELLAS